MLLHCVVIITKCYCDTALFYVQHACCNSIARNLIITVIINVKLSEQFQAVM